MSKENLIDDFVGGLDFDPLVILANILDVTVDPPPLGDMWPDWQGELVEDVCKAMGEVIEPLTEHPDVQRLIKQVAEYQIKNQELADKNVELQVELKKAHWAVALCLLKIADGKGVIGLIELPDGRVYSLPVEILAEAKQALKGETHDY